MSDLPGHKQQLKGGSVPSCPQPLRISKQWPVATGLGPWGQAGVQMGRDTRHLSLITGL